MTRESREGGREMTAPSHLELVGSGTGTGGSLDPQAGFFPGPPHR